MENLVVVNADADGYGTKRENIFVALDGNGECLGSLLIYPYFDYDIEPEHPHNLYLHLQAGREEILSEFVQDALLEHALRRAAEIKRDARQVKTRVYACFRKQQQAECAYFLQRGFTHDESMLILERHDPIVPPPVDVPDDVTIEAWQMATDTERQRFIAAHRRVFPRHAYGPEGLEELQALDGWANFTAFDHGEIAGNIMVFLTGDHKPIGYIEDLFVQKTWRRRGIGRCLLSTALAHFHSIDIQRVQLEFWSANRRALRLYHEFGFAAIDETELAVGRYV